jgi:uncharacterized protein (DUF2147 family)
MKRCCSFAVLMLLSFPVHAADSVSFVIGGHRIHIEAPRHCNSLSCVAVSIPGIHEARSRRNKFNNDGTAVARSTPPTPAAASTIPPVARPPAQPATCTPPPAPVRPAAPATQMVVTASVQPQIQPSPIQPAQPEPVKIVSTPPAPQPAQQIAVRPVEDVPPAPAVAPQLITISQQVDDEPTDTPLGNWQTEGKKGTVHIERCGRALCGYVLDPSSSAKGDTVLIDMKPKAASEWSGNIYSRDSGNIYYGTIALKGPNVLRVEACAIGKFWCSGNDWSRVDVTAAKLISSRLTSPEPRS